MRRRGGSRLRVDPIACQGIGMCAHVAPDLIRVDAWGYPIVESHPISARSDARQAKAAVRVCPRRALHLQEPAAKPTATAD